MFGQDLTYFKFVTALIDSGLWARMSSAARALYPVLLRFSDKNYKPVYPGTQTLLKLTGFKQKSTLRQARKELVELGLIVVQTGTGRKNTTYHFIFDRGVLLRPPPGAEKHPQGGSEPTLRGVSDPSPYNQIHISINNHVPEREKSDPLAPLRLQYGEQSVSLAISECNLAGIEASRENIEKILYRNGKSSGVSWSEMVSFLSQKISRGSLEMIEAAFKGEREGVLFFSDTLPDYLKALLRQAGTNLFFEPDSDSEEPSTTRLQFWQRAGAHIQ